MEEDRRRRTRRLIDAATEGDRRGEDTRRAWAVVSERRKAERRAMPEHYDTYRFIPEWHEKHVSHKIIKSWTRGGVPLQTETLDQARETAAMPFVYKHLALMPDAHPGAGSTIGSVIATHGAIMPAAVGVDIGCGMEAIRLDLTSHDLPESLGALRFAIEVAVPHGRTKDGGKGDIGSWGNAVPDGVNHVWNSLRQDDTWRALNDRHPRLDVDFRAYSQLGTLGTGNHFIELCLDEQDRVWVVLHSGSRGQGNRIGTYFIERAKKEMDRWHINLLNRDLAYLPEGHELFRDYVQAVEWAQNYALKNRQIMMYHTLRAIGAFLGKHRDITSTSHRISCHHNYLAREHHFGKNVWVTRKGAVRARTDDLGIIPGSMKTGSFIVRGLGNPDSFTSCSHGAGRTMSRAEARRTFTMEQHAESMKGIECELTEEAVLDETDGAYKPLDAVMVAQSDLVEIIHRLRPVLNVKGLQ